MRVDPAAKASGPRSPMRYGGAGAKPFEVVFREAEARFGLPVGLVEAVARAESGLDPRAVSPAGALGLMQLMPTAARAFGAEDPFDPVQNVLAGARYLRHLLDRFGGDLKLALAAYNAGPGAVRRFGGMPPYRETQRYVEKVLALLSEAKTGGRHEGPRPTLELAPAPEEVGMALGGGGLRGSGLELEAPKAWALGFACSAALRAHLAALQLAEALRRSGEDDRERERRV